MNGPICMTEDFWMETQLSIARHYGRVSFRGHEYWIVNKEGKDIFQCSIEADKAGRAKAIEPGEPADLVRKDFIPTYRKLGRDRFIEVLRDNPTATDTELKEIFKTLFPKLTSGAKTKRRNDHDTRRKSIQRGS